MIRKVDVVNELLKRVQLLNVRNSLPRSHTSDCSLLQVADRRVRTYSGGMKRRLSVALAFLGDPQIVFLGKTHLSPIIATILFLPSQMSPLQEWIQRFVATYGTSF